MEILAKNFDRVDEVWAKSIFEKSSFLEHTKNFVSTFCATQPRRLVSWKLQEGILIQSKEMLVGDWPLQRADNLRGYVAKEVD